VARPSKYSPEVQERICQAIALGADYEHAAAFAGIAYETLRVWREKFPAFSAALKEAEGRAMVKWLAVIERAAGDGTWQAAAWKLERRYPHLFGRTVQNVELSGPGAGPIPLAVVDKVLAEAKDAGRDA
jgi:hypothetical protein